MPADTDDLLPAERKVTEELGHLPLDFRAMAAVSNLFRASAAIRRHMEAKILANDAAEEESDEDVGTDSEESSNEAQKDRYQ